MNKKSGMLFFFFVMFFLTLSDAVADCGELADQNSGERIQTAQQKIRAEIALANMIIYSQEYMKYFFADYDSAIQPLPASGMSVFLGYDIASRSRILTALTLPLREEEVRRKNAEPFKYYYPKLMMIGYERDVYKELVFSESSCLRLSAGFGLALPLSYRFFQYFPPFVLSRAALRISSNVDLNFGIGYSGNIKSGAWFFPFGASYLLR